MITVQILKQSTGKPVKRARIAIGVELLMAGGVTPAQYTDANGEAHFQRDPCKGKIFVDGREKYKGRIEGRKVIYI